jgi:dihydrofolate reductase
MAKLLFTLNQSLDGYIDHEALGPPVPEVFHHFTQYVRDLTGFLYGRTTYEIMRYWDDDLPDWGQTEREFAIAWRSKPKWVLSRSLQSVGPNATLVAEDVLEVVRKLKTELPGDLGVGGPKLAHSLTQAGLIDEYRIYLRPTVVGHGSPFFAGPPPPLRLAASEPMAGDIIRLSYVPA